MELTTSVEGEADLDSVVLVTGGYDGKVKLFSYDMELNLTGVGRVRRNFGKMAYGSVKDRVVTVPTGPCRRRV